MTLPVKSIDEIEVKSGVSASDKILILDSVSEEARLASKTELKGDKGEKGDPGDKGDTGLQGPAGKDGANGKDGKDGKDGIDGKDGKDGKDGQDGQNGADGNGIASITSSKVGKTTTVTITETNGDSASFQILDGEDGSGGQGDGDVKGPASSTDGNVVIFDGVTGKKIKDSGKTIPTKVSDLSNDSGFITSAALPTKVSDLSNDSGFITGIDSGDVTAALGYTPYDSSNPSGYITSSDIPTDVSDFNNDAGYLTSSTGVTSVNGQTGAVTGLQPQHSDITVTLAAANWSSKSITVTATGVTASNTVIVSPIPSDLGDYADGGVYCSAQGSGTLTFGCDTEPTNDIDVNVVIFN